MTNPIDSDGTCPGCGALDGAQSQPAPPKVELWSCTACGLRWATTVVNPTVRIALDVIGLLPTPELRSTALLAVLRSEVHQRSGKEHPVNDTVVNFPLAEVISIDPMASVATAVWWCWLCDHEANALTAHSDGVEHLTTQHRATIGTAPDQNSGRPVPKVRRPTEPTG